MLTMAHKRDNFIAANSAANIVMLSFVLALCSMFNSGTQNAAAVMLSEVFEASVYM